MKKLYICGPDDRGEGVYYLLTEDGFGLASHLCSSASYAQSDLITGRPERIKLWAEYLKEGFEVKFASPEEETELYQKNEKFRTPEAMRDYEDNVLHLPQEK